MPNGRNSLDLEYKSLHARRNDFGLTIVDFYFVLARDNNVICARIHAYVTKMKTSTSYMIE